MCMNVVDHSYLKDRFIVIFYCQYNYIYLSIYIYTNGNMVNKI